MQRRQNGSRFMRYYKILRVIAGPIVWDQVCRPLEKNLDVTEITTGRPLSFFFRLLAQVGSFVCFVAASRRPDYYMLLRSYIGAGAWHWWFLPMKEKEAERKLARPNSFFIQSITAMKEAQQGPRRWLILHSTSFYPFLCSRHS